MELCKNILNKIAEHVLIVPEEGKEMEDLLVKGRLELAFKIAASSSG